MNPEQSPAPNPSGVEAFVAAYRDQFTQRPEQAFDLLEAEKAPELSWLRRAREAAFADWSARPLPGRDDERWRYTNLKALASRSVSLATWSSSRGRVAPLAPDAAAAQLVFVNGVFDESSSSLPERSGLKVTLLSKWAREGLANGWSAERLELVRRFRSQLEGSEAARDHVFAAMNTSMFTDGVVIAINDGAVIEEPIVISNFVFDRPAAGDVSAVQPSLNLISPRVFVHVGRGARASLMEKFVGNEAAATLINSVTDLQLDVGARLSHARVQGRVQDQMQMQIGVTRIHQQRDSFCETYQFSLGGELARHDLQIGLDGEGAEAVLDGLYMVEGRQHADNYTVVEHIKPHTTSSQLYKGILDGEARAVFNGRVRIHRDAQKSNASQLNKNLLLTARAEIDTRPELEIDADDVKASHGATVGRIDAEQVFYLQTRAIAKAEAERILARGFAMDIALRIRDEKLRDGLVHALNERFRNFRMGGGQ